MSAKNALSKEHQLLIIGLCTFIACISFKPSEPYLSEYLICNYDTQVDTCSEYAAASSSCSSSNGCTTNDNSMCTAVPCNTLNSTICNSDSAYYYCSYDTNTNLCSSSYCYKNFPESVVNNDIYPWSTYAYLPFLLVFGPFAELVSYRIAILVGIMGRVVTRFLLLYGKTLVDMQLMQVAYSMGTAAEDVFTAYIYYILPSTAYQDATSYIKTSALMSCLLSGILGDILVTQFNTSLRVLMIISAAFVCGGAVIGFFVIKASKKSSHNIYLTATADTVTAATSIQLANDIQSSIESEDLLINKATMTLKPFQLQLNCLLQAMKQPFIQTFAIWWLVGNSVFSVLYNYEVSIYIDLNHGSNSWNGTVLSVMLLAGSFGAMLPSWMHVKSMSEVKVVVWLLVMGILSCVVLILFALSWSLIPSICFLIIFFATWNFVNVIFYVQLAHALLTAKEHLIHNLGSSHDQPEPPYSMAVVLLVAMCVVLQIIEQAVMFSSMQLPMEPASFVLSILFVVATAVYTISVVYLYGVRNIAKELTTLLTHTETSETYI